MSFPGVIYDEAHVPAYTLPELLVMADGTPVNDAQTWREKRRPEILRLLTEHMFGRLPNAALTPAGMWFEEITPAQTALNGLALRKEVLVHFTPGSDGPRMALLLYLPAHAAGPVPAFLGLNFTGNHTIRADAGITLSDQWMPSFGQGVVDNRATEAARGAAASLWDVEVLLERGYGLVTAYCGDLDPDFDDGFQNGVHPLFYQPDQSLPAANEWGTIAAWAWGLSRALDYLQTDPLIDARKVVVMGHSRLGKTAVWAGAADERFAMVISNNSGCAGAALSRRHFGETIKLINDRFPHWFCANFRRYNDRENELPFDQHQLLALVAPRPLYVASAEEDRWSDPRGEFLSALYASPVYRLLGKEGLPVDEMPALNQAVMGTVAYHIRTGGHAVTSYDWARYLDFADRYLK